MTSSFNTNHVNRIIEEDAPSLMPNGSIVAAKISARDIEDGYAMVARDGVGAWGVIATGGGSGLLQIVTVNSTTTLTLDDQVALVTGGITVTLPATHTSGQAHTVKDAAGTARTNPITVNAVDDIDGAASDTIDTAWAAVTYISDGTNWFRI